MIQNEQTWGYYGSTAPALYQHDRRPESYASSSASRDPRGPEGPEREVPETNKFLALAPAAGLGEERHRRASFRSEMMRRYVQEPQEACEGELQQDKPQYQPQAYSSAHQYSGRASGERSTFLNQDVYMPPPSGRGSGKTRSWDSEGSGGSGGSVLEHWETVPVDHVIGVGAWAVPVSGEDSGYAGIAASFYEYPMNMSGMTEALYDTERR